MNRMYAPTNFALVRTTDGLDNPFTKHQARTFFGKQQIKLIIHH